MKLITLSIAFGGVLGMEWQAFKDKYNKIYATETDELIHRYNYFKAIVEIQEHNHNPLSTFKMGINEFTDMTYQQLKVNRLMNLPYPEDETELDCPLSYVMQNNIPTNFNSTLDWRDPASNPRSVTAVTAVKDQGACGSCYAFSTTAAMEGNLCVNGQYDCSTWQGISEQQILDCGAWAISEIKTSTKQWYPFYGCMGGWQPNVAQFAYYTRGVANSADYPYTSGTTGKTSECQAEITREAYPDRNICGTTSKHGANATVIKEAIFNQGPLAVGMYVGGSFSSYVSGVYVPAAGDCPDMDHTGINHAMAAVGYGTENGLDYWIIRNSWSSDWGDNGYIKVVRGINACGIEGNIMYANMVKI